MTDHPTPHKALRIVWLCMNRRCSDPKHDSYNNYGGRGIKVCDRWKSYNNFYEDMSDDYFDGAQIDRINNNGDYEPSNCRWVTKSQNAIGRRKKDGCHSKYRGVTYCNREKRWLAQIKQYGKSYSLGYYDHEIDAAVAYNEAAKSLHRSFAQLNAI